MPDRFFTLKVVYDSQLKRVGVEGDLDDKDLCVMLLLDGIKAVMMAKEKSKIVVPGFVSPRLK